jgi:chromosomal replication initiator protein
LIRLISEAKIKKTEITPEFVESLIDKGGKENGKIKNTTPGEVIGIVSKYFSVGKRALLGDSRARPIARPRQILMYFLRTNLGLPLEEVGRLIGDRDHTTVMHAVEKITYLASTDVKVREDLMGIKNML